MCQAWKRAEENSNIDSDSEDGKRLKKVKKQVCYMSKNVYFSNKS